MEILITGCAGFIGSNLAEKLLQRGYKVTGIDNLNDYYSPKKKYDNLKILDKFPKFKFQNLDIEDKSSLIDFFNKKSFDKMIHLAARAGVRPSLVNPELYFQTNVQGTSNLLEISRLKQIKHFIFASSSSVYGNCREVPFKEDSITDFPISPYAATKKSAEVLCFNYSNCYGVNATILRFFTAYGPRNRPDMAAFKFTDAIFRERPIEMYGDGSMARDYTYIGDITEGIIKALKYPKKFEIFNLGSSSPIQLREFINQIEITTGKKANIIQKPIPQGDVEITYADINKAKTILNWTPKITLKEGIKELVQWYRKNNY